LKNGTADYFEISADGCERNRIFEMLVLSQMSMRTSGPAGLGAGAQRLVDDGLNGACATATLGAATEAPVDLLGIAGKVLGALDGIAHVVVTQHVAGTDDH
jgi:hypothetical protein